MLVILPVRPVSVPFKTVCSEQLVAQIFRVYFVRKILAPVYVLFCGCRLKNPFAVDFLDVGIIQCVDVNR